MLYYSVRAVAYVILLSKGCGICYTAQFGQWHMLYCSVWAVAYVILLSMGYGICYSAEYGLWHMLYCYARAVTSGTPLPWTAHSSQRTAIQIQEKDFVSM